MCDLALDSPHLQLSQNNHLVPSTYETTVRATELEHALYIASKVRKYHQQRGNLFRVEYPRIIITISDWVAPMNQSETESTVLLNDSWVLGSEE
ncbi:uncharacterized protein YALI1_C18726g [Yarrowia lipolytica]|uniref:Uncharacterized protein n=1 Tax=Yarrowia lipolytica TaxID=4952 RepID=A0A1D8NAZ9_YARLL|nr:hypothetical protein YALI1_C18726g [Yarrowia lipolytica]